MSMKPAILTFVSACVLLGCSNAPARRAAPNSAEIGMPEKTGRQYSKSVPTAEQSARIRELLRSIREERP